MRCPLCHASDETDYADYGDAGRQQLFVHNARDGSVCCTDCGCVVEDERITDASLQNSKLFVVRIKKSASYRRKYHWSERLAQRNNKDPRVVDSVVSPVSQAILEDPRKDPDTLGCTDVCAILRSVGLKKHCERWVQILYRATCGDPDIDEDTGKPLLESYAPNAWHHSWLPDHVERQFRLMFDVVNAAFDRLLFVKGKRDTLKTRNCRPEKTKLSRHNMIHFNFLFRQFHKLVGQTFNYDAETAFEAKFFFPLLRTAAVMKETNKRWKLICDNIDWPFIELKSDIA